MKIIFEDNPNAANLASDFLKLGKVICFASDTVYGLAADAQNEEAVQKLYRIKRRNQNKPIAIFISKSSIAKKLFVFNNLAKKIVDKFFPGQLTLVLKKLENPEIKLADSLNTNDDFLGFRIVDNKFVNDILQNFSGIMAVTSANISGNKSAISVDEVVSDISSAEIDLIVDGGICKGRIPSTVIKIIDNEIILLREGKISFDEIKKSL